MASMSGITGIFRRDGRDIDPSDIKKMNDKIVHRGPDGSNVWCEGPVAFGHQMLHTTPESLHEELPFEDEELGLVITADARIDNREDLAPKLGIEDKEYVSDSYFILKSYEKWGEKCPEELLGDFAFAIWDKNKEILFCARDHMGVKPFYYYLSDDFFVFATEIKAILSIDNIPCQLNEKRLALFLLVKDFHERNLTFYNNIISLSAANYLEIRKNKIYLNQYWELNPKSQILFESDEDYVREFLKLFKESVKCRIRSNKPLGVMLSGGLDSSSVTCTARKILNKNGHNTLHSFSYIFDDFPESDERYYIKKVLDIGGIKPHYILCDEINPLKNIEKILEYQDQPTSSFQIAMVHESRKKIEKIGINILLTGEGGDQIVSHGEKYLEELLLTFQWKKLINNVNYVASIKKTNKYKIFFSTFLATIKYYLLKFSWLNICSNSDLTHLLRKKLVKSFFSYNNDSLNRCALIKPKEYHYYNISMISHQKSFEIMDQGSAFFLIEMRHPFYDKRLIEFCFAIPTEMKIKYGFDRYLLRLAMEKTLPNEIQWRTKKANIAFASLKNFLSNKNILKEIFNDKNTVLRDYVRFDKFKVNKNKCKPQPSIFVLFIWRLTLLHFWLTHNRLKKE